jgi:hypothetical protein
MPRRRSSSPIRRSESVRLMDTLIVFLLGNLWG